MTSYNSEYNRKYVYNDNDRKINALDNLQEYYENNYKLIKFYKILKNITYKNDILLNKIEQLKKNDEIIFYENKISLFKKFNNVKECIVCYENKLHINRECDHEICEDCYW